jgi:hypothetical protein
MRLQARIPISKVIESRNLLSSLLTSATVHHRYPVSLSSIFHSPIKCVPFFHIPVTSVAFSDHKLPHKLFSNVHHKLLIPFFSYDAVVVFVICMCAITALIS